jgi:hypothetical protein
MNHETPSFIQPLSVTFPLQQEGFDQPVTVTAANVAQLSRMLQLLLPMLQELMALQADTLDRLVSEEGPTHTDVLQLLDMLGEQPGLAAELVAVATGMPLPRVEQLLPDRFAYLFAVTLQVNADFFGRARPALAAAVGKFSALLPQGTPPAAPLTAGPASSAS